MSTATATAQEPHQKLLPTINLLCRFESNSQAFNAAIEKYFPTLPQITDIKVHNCSLARLPSDVEYDAIVSPANSYGFMDGAFDDAISVALSPNPREGYGWTTKKVQTTLYQKWKGYAPPGSCTIIDVRRDAAWHDIKNAELERSASAPQNPPAWHDQPREHQGGCKYIALCPTMRVPQNVQWDREVIYECIWSLLCALDTHNQEVIHSQQSASQIKSILMTPLATGVGKVSETKWAAQCVLAMEHWVESVENSQRWSSPEWHDVYEGRSEILQTTHGL